MKRLCAGLVLAGLLVSACGSSVRAQDRASLQGPFKGYWLGATQRWKASKPTICAPSIAQRNAERTLSEMVGV